MCSYESIIIDVESSIATVTLHRPNALNAINSQTMDELADWFENIPKLSGVIITGSGEKAFAAGADINDFAALNASNIEAFVRRGHDLFNTIEQLEIPVIAAIQGYALGAGCELAMACHLRVATENSRFGQPEVNLGIVPGYGGTQRLIQLIGKGRANQLLMTGETIDAQRAHAIGLVNYLVSPGNHVQKARAVLYNLSQKAPLAIAKIIETTNAFFSDQKGFEAEIKAFCALSSTDDFKEGSAAFLEKRKANFSGK